MQVIVALFRSVFIKVAAAVLRRNGSGSGTLYAAVWSRRDRMTATVKAVHCVPIVNRNGETTLAVASWALLLHCPSTWLKKLWSMRLLASHALARKE